MTGRAVTADDARDALQVVHGEVSTLLAAFDVGQLPTFVSELLAAKRVYIAGQGRSGLAGRGLAQRLMHNGLTTYVVGEIAVPAVSDGDLFIGITASGTTSTTVHQAQRAKAAGARVIAVALPGDSPLGGLADWSLLLPRQASDQHATTAFCQAAQLIFDTTCRLVQQELGLRDEDLHQRHTNFE